MVRKTSGGSALARNGARLACIAAAATALAAGCPAGRQKQAAAPEAPPLERTFHAGEQREYSIQLKVQMEKPAEAESAEEAKPPNAGGTSYAEVSLSWRAKQRVVEVDGKGIAQVEETLTDFRLEPAGQDSQQKAEGKEASLGEELAGKMKEWMAPAGRTLEYRENARGQVMGQGKGEAPEMGEDAAGPVTRWLKLALRPTAELPVKPGSAGARWQEKENITMMGWSGLRASTSGEWMEAAGGNGGKAISLLTTEQITGRVDGGTAKTEGDGEGAAFHSESLATLSLWDGHMSSGTRSATLEVTRNREIAAGKKDGAERRQRVAAEVEIRECRGNCGGQ